MSTRFVLRFALAALTACSSSYSPEPAPLGTLCSEDSDCDGDAVCASDGARLVCTRECRALGPTAECPEGWICGEGDESHPTVCRCESRVPERCNDRDDDCDGAIDEGRGCRPEPGDPAACGEELECFDVRTTPIDAVDMLLVIDDSSSMGLEQLALVRELPRMFAAMTSGDLNADGVGDLSPVRSLQVGVVSTDMGVGGFVVPTCAERFGDDGVLLTRGNVDRPACADTYPTFFDFSPSDDPLTLAENVSCVAAMGTAGCGFEQQLEAALKAVTPSTSPLRFESGSVGHADVRNAGFLRQDSILLIMFLTDEEDCSAADPSIFDPSDGRFGDLSLRCFEHGDPALGFVHPIERYVDGLIAARSDGTRLVVSGIAGIPAEVSTRPGMPSDWDAILDHPDMQEILDPEMPSRLRPSCDRTDAAGGRSLALPPRRIVRTLQGLERYGAHASMHSICRDELGVAIDATLLTLGDAMTPCFARSVDPARCRLLETLPPGRLCAELPDRTLRERTEDASGRPVEVCEVTPGASASDGWSYAAGDASCPASRPNRLFVSVPPPDGARVRLVCER